MMNKQYAWDFDTGDAKLVPTRATERPQLEQQANLLDWGWDRKKWDSWSRPGALKTYVCANCRVVQVRHIPEDGDRDCLQCGANALEVRS